MSDTRQLASEAIDILREDHRLRTGETLPPFDPPKRTGGDRESVLTREVLLGGGFVCMFLITLGVAQIIARSPRTSPPYEYGYGAGPGYVYAPSYAPGDLRTALELIKLLKQERLESGG